MKRLKEKLEQKLHHSSEGAQYPSQQRQQSPQLQNRQQEQQPIQPQHPHKQPDITQQTIDIFLLSKQDNGEIGGLGYWQTANGYTAILLHDQWPTPSPTKNNTVTTQDLLVRVERHHRGFINEFNDDTLWWGLCLLHFFHASGDRAYLDKAAKVWRHMNASVVRRGQFSVCGMDMGGAVFWTTKPGEDQLNSITTGLFAELCGLLAALPGHLYPAQLPQRECLLDAGKNALGWILRCRYREIDCVVLDHVRIRTDELVDWSFTYTTGQTIAACVALYAATDDESYISLAAPLAKKSVSRRGWVEADGTLTEAGAYGSDHHEAWQNNDSVGFKSVLVRSLAKLYQSLEDRSLEIQLQRDIERFVRVNFDSLVNRNTNGKGQFGPWWAGPMDLPTSHSQLAVLDVMAAVKLVYRP